MIHNKKILISGIGGSVGSELARQLFLNNEVYGFDINETEYFSLCEELGIKGRLADIRDKALVKEIIDSFHPDIIFHAAALKHVTPSMQIPREYVTTNLIGTLNLLEVSKGIKFVNISTDKAVNCDNVMGWSKKGTELFTRIAGGISVRFGNVLGSRGSLLPIWQKQIEEGKPVTVTDARAERYMMTIQEAVELVIEAAEKGGGGEIFILDLEKRKVNVLELAKRIISESGSDVPIEMIGLRPGESISEELMSYGEKENCSKEGKFWVCREKVNQ